MLMRSQFDLIRLDSGLRLVIVPMRGVESITALVLVGIGSRYEPEKTAGVAHFLEHTLMDGTTNYPTSLDISTAIDGVGGEHNAFTSKDYTGYYVKVASSHLELALDVLSDVVFEPKLAENDIAKEKKIIVEEINMYEDNPRVKVGNVYDEVVFGKTALGRDVIGFKETVTGLTRDDLVGFLDCWYDRGNMVVVIAGDEERIQKSHRRPAEPSYGGQAEVRIQSLVEKYFRKGKKRLGGGKSIGWKEEQTKQRVQLIHRKTEQAHFYLGVPSVARTDPTRYTALVLSVVLGGNSSARLFNEIREKHGLAYYAYASMSSYAEVGTLYAFEGVDPTRIDQAIGLTLAEFANMAGEGKEPIRDEEVERAKDYLAGKLVLDWEDSQSVAMTYAKKLVLEGKVETPDEILEHIRAVTVNEVRSLGKRLFVPKKLNLALIGDYKDEERFLKLLAF